MKGTLHEDQCALCIISRPLPLGMRNVSDKVVENDERYQLDATIMIYYHK